VFDKSKDVCQNEDKKNPKSKVKHTGIYIFFDTRNQNRPQGLRIDHWIV
jgi:exonuclease III